MTFYIYDGEGGELLEVVIERVHLGDLAGREILGVRHRDRRRRIETGAGRLDGDDEARLLTEARRHRHLVGMDDGGRDGGSRGRYVGGDGKH